MFAAQILGFVFPGHLIEGFLDYMWGHKQLICVSLPWQAATLISFISSQEEISSHFPFTSERLSTSAEDISAQNRHLSLLKKVQLHIQECSRKCSYSKVTWTCTLLNYKKGVCVHFPLIKLSQEQKIKMDIQEIPQLWGFKNSMYSTGGFYSLNLETNPLPTSPFSHFPLATFTAEV